jgi:GDP-6-deoxy-D-talose 4-dehydrogenase
MKKILVTGAGGFVGKYIAEYLQKQGYAVTGIVREKRAEYSFPIAIQDLSHEMKLCGTFDAIVHAAGSLPYNQKDFREFKKNNIDAMANLIEFAKKNNIFKVIYLSTIGVHGEFRDEVINENSDIINPDYYGITKYAAELLLRAEKSIDSISLRMPGIIGRGSKGVWLPNTVEKFRRNEDVQIYSPDFVTKNFVCVQDLANFIRVLIEKKKFEKNAVMLACSEGATVRKIVMQIKKMTKSESEIIIDNGIRQSFCIDNASAVKMGYKSMNALEIIDKFV